MTQHVGDFGHIKFFKKLLHSFWELVIQHHVFRGCQTISKTHTSNMFAKYWKNSKKTLQNVPCFCSGSLKQTSKAIYPPFWRAPCVFIESHSHWWKILQYPPREGLSFYEKKKKNNKDCRCRARQHETQVSLSPFPLSCFFFNSWSRGICHFQQCFLCVFGKFFVQLNIVGILLYVLSMSTLPAPRCATDQGFMLGRP